ncbi:T9SS C-terminal target domain-containing protein [Flexithrix dorotheae]|uniref:T9SS C-terminal target domain-containing protein n=1 Tax=Flexithrix dorotheae TaxID=70993 RepID=UPI000368FCD3|nr:T9SS C-terminal target domain-containing protein [Flexithrix dorotheae]
MEKKYRLKLFTIFTAFIAFTLPAIVFGQSTFTMDPNPASDCGGLRVEFENTTGCAFTTETWDFGDGSTPLTRNVTNATTTPIQRIFNEGVFSVTLTTSCGGVSTTQTVTVSSSPSAVIDPFTLVGNCVPQFVSLNGRNSTHGSAGTSIVDYLWTIENIETGTRSASFDEVFNFTFTDPGRYRISLRVTDDSGCENLGFYDEVITLGEGFNAGFLPDTRQVSCTAPFEVNFQYILDPGNYTIIWDFGDGNTLSTTLDDTQDPSAIPVTHTYDALGSYDVTMQITNEAGCTIVDTKPALVEIVDFVPGFIVNNAAGCSPFTATFTPDFTQGDQTLTWNFGDGTTLTGLASDPDIYSPEHLYENVGLYDVTLTVSDDPNGCDGTITENDFIEVYPNAIADFSVNNASTFCDPANANVQFLNLSSAETETVIWDLGDGSPLLTINRGDADFNQIDHDYSGPDNTSYTVSLTAISANGCESTVEYENLVQVQSTVVDFGASSASGCAGDFFVTLFDNTSSAVIAFNYEWEIRNSATNVLVESASGPEFSEFSFPLTMSGDYDVSLTITNSCGTQTLEKTEFLQVGIAPVSVDFTPSATQICNQTEVTFTNDYQGDTTGVTFGWDFLGVDSVFSTDFEGTYIYDNQDPGIITVALYVNSNGCLDTVYKDIEILAPKAALEFHTDECALDTIYLVDRSVGASVVNWTVTVGGSNIPVSGSPKQVPIFVPAGATWEARIEAVNASSLCTDEFTIGGTQPNFGIPNFDALTAIKGNNCFPTAVRFNDTGELEVPGSTITNYRWDFGNGEISNEASPQIVYTEPGYYSVSLSITTDLGCTFDTTYSDFVQITGPQINFEVCDAGTCKDNEVSFRDLTTSINPIASWEWDFGDGGTSTDQNPSYTYTDINAPQDRFYWVKLTVTDDQGCSAIDSVKVRPTKPEGEFDIVQEPACGGEMVSFLHLDSLSVGLRPLNAQWDFDNGTSAQGLEPTLFFEGSLDGITYEVTALIFDLNSCLDTVVKTFTVYKDEINPEFTASPLNGACPPLEVTFEKTLPALVGPNAGPGRANSIYAYIWDFGDGVVLADSAAGGPQDMITYTYRNPGEYYPSLTVIDATGCDSTYTLQPNPIVVDGPEGTFTATDTIGYPDLLVETQVDDPVDGFTYIWDFGEGTLTTGIDTVNTYTIPGSYTLAMQIDDGSCQFTADEKQILVLPCPFIQDSTINWCTSQGPLTVDVFDSTHILQLGTMNYEWRDLSDPGAGIISDGSSIQVTPANNLPETRTYSVRVYVDDLTHGSNLNDDVKCDQTVTITVNFIPSPEADFTYTPACNSSAAPPSFLVNFADISNYPGGSPVDSLLWDFDNDSIYAESINNPGPTGIDEFGSGGIFPVGLIVKNQDGCADTIRKNIYIPMAEFTFENACAGQEVVFSDSSAYDPANPGTTFSWVFGDGNTAGGTEADSVVTNVFDIPDDYNVQLTVETFLPDGTPCEVTITKTITISPLPEPLLQVMPACTDQATMLIGNVDPLITEWQWDFDNDGTVDTTTTTNSVTYNYPTIGGPFESALTIVTGDGCSATEVFGPIIVTSSPEAAYEYENACLGESINFENNSTIASGNIVRSEWYFTSNEVPDFVFDDTRDVSFAYQVPNVYNVMLKVYSDGLCEDSVVQTVVVSEPPIARFVSPDSVCGGQPVSFLDQSSSPGSAIISYLWDFDSDGLIDAEGNNPSYTFPVTGQSFDVTLNVITLAGCSGSITQPVFVKDPPVIETSEDEYICEGEEVTLSVINPLPDGVYVWDNNGGVGPEVKVMPSVSTLYTVTYTDSLGCTAESFVNISVVSFPESLPNNDTIVCDVDQFVLDATIPGGLPATYTWLPGGETSPTIIVEESGVYTVTATVAGFDGTARECTITRDITVEFNPEPDLVPDVSDACFQNDEVVTLEVPASYTTVVWTSPDLPNPVFARSITVVQEGMYYVTASNETCIVSDSVEVQELCEPRLFVPTAFTPNGDGTNDVFNVKGKNFARYELTIFNRWGEIIFKTEDKDQGWEGYYLGELMPAGVYPWMVRYESELTPGDPIVKYGSVTLIR